MLQTQDVAATSFFIHRTEIFDFVVRWDKKVYRRQKGSERDRSWKHTMMGGFKIWHNSLVRYFIGITLLVKIQILFTQKWVAQCDAPLRSGKHTERIFVYKLYGFWFGYFINTALLVGLYKCINDKYGGTLPVLKNEIIDVCLCPAVRKRNLWFRIWALRGYFARLGTGRTYRCSYLHNVCRPATAVFAILYKIIRKKPAITGSHTNTAICDDNLMRNG